MTTPIRRRRATPLALVLLTAALCAPPAAAQDEDLSADILLATQQADLAEQRARAEAAEFDLRTKRAAADQAEVNARAALASGFKAEPLKGSVNVEKFDAAGKLVAVDLAKLTARRLCDRLRADGARPVLLHDSTIVNSILAAKALQHQLEATQRALDDANAKLAELKPGVSPPRITIEGMGRGQSGVVGLSGPVSGFATVGLAVTGIRSIAELASLFKTNLTLASADITTAKAMLLTAMAHDCHNSLVTIGLGYTGGLDFQQFEKLLNQYEALLLANATLADHLDRLQASDAKKRPLANVKVLAAQATAFIAALRGPGADEGPLKLAAQFLTLAERVTKEKPRVLDLDFQVQGVTILRDSFFSGQKLRVSATAITSYRLYEANGTLVAAYLWRELLRPRELDLRGKDYDQSYWGRYDYEPPTDAGAATSAPVVGSRSAP